MLWAADLGENSVVFPLAVAILDSCQTGLFFTLFQSSSEPMSLVQLTEVFTAGIAIREVGIHHEPLALG